MFVFFYMYKKNIIIIYVDAFFFQGWTSHSWVPQVIIDYTVLHVFIYIYIFKV